jgi:hypothetical protein
MDLTAKFFRALYLQYRLDTVHGTHVVTLATSPCWIGSSLGAIARQTSEQPPSRADNPASPSPRVEISCPASRSSSAMCSRWLVPGRRRTGM